MPKIVDHDQYRKELLTKCFDLLAQKGYASITMRQIAREIGISTGTLYHYFPSKEALFLQLVAEQTWQDTLNFQVAAGSPATLSERIDILMEFAAKNEDYFCRQILIWIDFYRTKDPDELLNNEILKQANERAREVTGNYLHIQDKALVDLIVSLIHGLLLVRLFEGETVSFAEQGALLAKMIAAYLEQKQQEHYQPKGED